MVAVMSGSLWFWLGIESMFARVFSRSPASVHHARDIIGPPAPASVRSACKVNSSDGKKVSSASFFQQGGQAQHHFAARVGTAGFNKTQVPGRDAGIGGQIQLAQSPPLAPGAQVFAKGCG